MDLYDFKIFGVDGRLNYPLSTLGGVYQFIHSLTSFLLKSIYFSLFFCVMKVLWQKD